MMLNSKARLSSKIFTKEIDMIPTRQGYGEGLVIAGEQDSRVVVLCADLTESTRSILFKEKFPERFIECGVAEQGMATIAAGMANYGKIPFISSYAAFSPGRNWEQIRTTIALNDVPVKIAGAHAGISVGPDGATHQMLEDLALMRAMPNMIVLSPADAIEAKKATVAAAKIDKPVYIRLAREKTEVFTTEETPFDIGKANVLCPAFAEASAGEGRHGVTIFATGPLVYKALEAAEALSNPVTQSPSNSVTKQISCEVINIHTLKPLDVETIVNSVKKTKCAVTVEEHQIHGGLFGAISECLAQNYPVPIVPVAMPDCFGESGKPEELLVKYELSTEAIMKAVLRVVSRS